MKLDWWSQCFLIHIISKFDIEEGILKTYEMEVDKATYYMVSINKLQIINGLEY